MGRIWRVHHPDLPAEAGASFDLTPEEGRHVNRVLRLRAGEPIAIFDGAGKEWRGTIEASGSDHVSVRLEEPVEEVVEPELEIVLFQALVKPEHAEWLLQKVTEVGVAAVVFFTCESRSGVSTVGAVSWSRPASRVAAAACPNSRCGRRCRRRRRGRAACCCNREGRRRRSPTPVRKADPSGADSGWRWVPREASRPGRWRPGARRGGARRDSVPGRSGRRPRGWWRRRSCSIAQVIWGRPPAEATPVDTLALASLDSA